MDQPSYPSSPGNYKYYDLVMAGFVTVLLCSNLIGPGKVCLASLPIAIWGWTPVVAFGAGNLFFPISYIFGDILTEVYGYARARRVIWAGFAAMIFATVMSLFVVNFAADPAAEYNTIIQPALEVVFGNAPRIIVASILAFWAGDFANSFVLAKMKILTRGKHLWMRTISSTAVGQTVDSLLFYPIAFYGVWDNQSLLKVVIFNCLFKVAVEAVFTPLTCAIVRFLKRVEQVDFFDYDTNFTPFSLRT